METEAGASLGRWIEATWHPTMPLRDWWRALADSGYAFPTWPDGLGGRGWSPAASRQVAAALVAAKVIGPPSGVGQTMGGPTVLAHGTDGQRQALIPALASGADMWCQLFSEPGAGSDLASLATSAERDGQEWVVNGQKVWSSGAHLADRGLLLARTDGAAAKHEGISYFVIDMDQPGIEVRPLRQMNGEAEFCEVFLADARVAHDRLIGREGDGWRIAQTTLAFERTGVSAAASRGASATPGRRAGMLDRPVGDIVRTVAGTPRAAITGYVLGNRTLGALAHDANRDRDVLARQQLAAFRARTEVNRYNSQRARAAAAQGQRPGPESSTGKLAMSGIARASRDLGFSLMGAYGMLDGPDAPAGGAVHRVALNSFGAAIGGGTDEIQRNVIGERALGLPKEPQVERDLPFDDARQPTEGRT